VHTVSVLFGESAHLCFVFPYLYFYVALRMLFLLSIMNTPYSTHNPQNILSKGIVSIFSGFPALYNTPLTFISSMWPIVNGLISAVYCGKCLTVVLSDAISLVLTLRCFARVQSIRL